MREEGLLFGRGREEVFSRDVDRIEGCSFRRRRFTFKDIIFGWRGREGWCFLVRMCLSFRYFGVGSAVFGFVRFRVGYV